MPAGSHSMSLPPKALQSTSKRWQGTRTDKNSALAVFRNAQYEIAARIAKNYGGTVPRWSLFNIQVDKTHMRKPFLQNLSLALGCHSLTMLVGCTGTWDLVCLLKMNDSGLGALKEFLKNENPYVFGPNFLELEPSTTNMPGLDLPESVAYQAAIPNLPSADFESNPLENQTQNALYSASNELFDLQSQAPTAPFPLSNSSVMPYPDYQNGADFGIGIDPMDNQQQNVFAPNELFDLQSQAPAAPFLSSHSSIMPYPDYQNGAVFTSNPVESHIDQDFFPYLIPRGLDAP